jgi:hypothetical protein
MSQQTIKLGSNHTFHSLAFSLHPSAISAPGIPSIPSQAIALLKPCTRDAQASDRCASLVFDHVYTTVDAEAEPFAEPEFIARGVSSGILNSDVNHGFHVQQSRRSFR